MTPTLDPLTWILCAQGLGALLGGIDAGRRALRSREEVVAALREIVAAAPPTMRRIVCSVARDARWRAAL